MSPTETPHDPWERLPQWLVVALWVTMWYVFGHVARCSLPFDSPWAWWILIPSTLCGAILGAYFAEAEVMPSAVGGGVGCWAATFCYFAAADFLQERPIPFTGFTEDFSLQFTFETVIYPGLAMLFGFACGALGGWIASGWPPPPAP